MIHEEICTYEVSKLAKEKGFNEYEACNHIYEDDEQWHTLTPYTNAKGIDWSKDKFTVAPTQSLLQRWLREGKHIVVVVDWFSIERKYYWRVFDTTKDDMFASFIPPAKSMSRYDTWEQALESGLKYGLENLVV